LHLILIRHGQSANNALPESQRVSDPGLTTVGHDQAALLAARLGMDAITHIYCSAFRRALETAAPLASATNLAPHVRWDLFEQGGCYAGYLPGKTRPDVGMGRTEIATRFPKWSIDPKISDHGWYHGQPLESNAAAMNRARNVVRWITNEVSIERHATDKVAFVIHADFKMLLLKAMADSLDKKSSQVFDDFYADGCEPWNTSITHLQGAGSDWQIESLNCVEHLPAELRTS
jgi:2,3-bisphosphoglycerate-dependent phosphoglycerate mutase